MERKPRKRKAKGRKSRQRTASRVKTPAESEHYFVRIADSIEARRKLLESSKVIIHSLKGYYQLLAIRRLKREMMNRLKKELKELTVILNKLEEDLPISSEREVRQLIEKRKPKPEKKKKKTETPEIIETEIDERTKREMTRMQQLEQALRNVEGKLERL